jgi:hypothetical protein
MLRFIGACYFPQFAGSRAGGMGGRCDCRSNPSARRIFAADLPGKDAGGELDWSAKFSAYFAPKYARNAGRMARRS